MSGTHDCTHKRVQINYCVGLENCYVTHDSDIGFSELKRWAMPRSIGNLQYRIKQIRGCYTNKERMGDK